MADPILCHVCEHDIDNHDLGECCDCPGAGRGCHQWVSDIARAYAEERWLDGVDVGYVLGRSHSKRDEKGDRE